MSAAQRTAHRLRVSWPLLLGTAAFLAALLSGAARIGADTYWHISAGRWMLAHARVPTHDPFSFTMHGAPWIAQEWGAELLMAVVYGIGGWPALVLLVAASFALAIAYVAHFLLPRMEPLHTVLLTVLGACMMFSYILVRPQQLVWPLAALWIGGLIDAGERGAAPPWWLLAVMLLWANLHASFILGLLLAVPIALEAVLGARPAWKPAAGRWGLFLAAAVGCALVNPQGYRLLIYPFRVLGMPALEHISEWQQPNFQQLHVFGLWLLALLALAFGGRIRLPLLRSAMLIGLIYFALQHIRNVSLLGLIAPLLIAGPLARLWRERPVHARDAGALDRGFRALARPASGAAVWATVVLAGALGVAAVRLRKPSVPAQVTPRAALAALLARRPAARILNDYNFGGYLIFRGIPVFVDGRTDMYGNRFIESYFNAVELARKGNFPALLQRYRIDAILMGPEWPVVQLLERLPQWRRVYAGKVAVAYVRAGAQSRASADARAGGGGAQGGELHRPRPRGRGR